MTYLKPLLGGACIALLGACTPPISEQTAKEFGALSTAAASVAGTPDRLQRELWFETAKNRNLCAYLRGNTYALNPASGKPPVTALAAEQATAGKALTAYVKALVEASRGKSIEELEKAQSGFGEALGVFATAAGADSRFAGLTGQALELIERAGESSRQRRIRSIMSNAIDPLFQLEALLTRDVAQVTSDTEAFARDWNRAARCVLSASRRNANAKAQYEALTQRRGKIDADLKLIRSGPAAVRKLRIAHIDAVTSTRPLDEVFAEIVEILKEVEALVETVEGKENS